MEKHVGVYHRTTVTSGHLPCYYQHADASLVVSLQAHSVNIYWDCVNLQVISNNPNDLRWHTMFLLVIYSEILSSQLIVEGNCKNWKGTICTHRWSVMSLLIAVYRWAWKWVWVSWGEGTVVFVSLPLEPAQCSDLVPLFCLFTISWTPWHLIFFCASIISNLFPLWAIIFVVPSSSKSP